MAVKQQRVCDVFPGGRDVRPYRVSIVCLTDETALLPDAAVKTVWTKDLDLSQRGLDRLKRFTMRGSEQPSNGAAE